MNNKYFSDIYNDFFKVEKEEIKIEDEKKENIDIVKEISNLYLDNESKNLLKQILEYMDKYAKKEENNYINFNIILQGNNKENENKILDILSESVNNNHYLKNKNVIKLSLFDLNNKTNLNEIYNNGIVLINDLSSFIMQDENDKKIFLHNLKNNLNNKNITLLCGTKEEINIFLFF